VDDPTTTLPWPRISAAGYDDKVRASAAPRALSVTCMPRSPSLRASRISNVGVSGGRKPACATTGRSLIDVRLSGITDCECEWMTDMTSGRAL
jgi:hypothetical protein